MRITFLETRVVDDCRKGTPEEERYEAGESYALAEASARHWIDRGIAVEAVPAAAMPAEPDVPPPPPAPPVPRRQGKKA